MASRVKLKDKKKMYRQRKQGQVFWKDYRTHLVV